MGVRSPRARYHARTMKKCLRLRWIATALLGVSLLVPAGARAREGDGDDRAMAPPSERLRRSITLGVETLRLPGGERLGLASSSLLFEVGPSWWLGPAVFGAATGRRGGLFVGGVEGQRRWRWDDGVEAFASLALGGGGGGAAPVGSGLLVRSQVGVTRPWGPLKAGLTWSDARFPSGAIFSRQLGVVLVWDGDYAHWSADAVGRGVAAGTESGLGFDRWHTGWLRHHIQGDVRRVGLISARAERHLGDDGRWTWGFDAAAAAQGGAAGYMELLAGVGWMQPVTRDLHVGARAGVGLAGGGAVPSGGGVLAKAGLQLAWSVAPGWQLGVEQGLGRGIAGQPALHTHQVWIGRDLVPHQGSPLPASALEVVGYQWVAGVQHVQAARRISGRVAPFDEVIGKMNRRLDEHFYLSLQAHSAYAGGVGAYSVGLLGLGWRDGPEAPQTWHFGAETLIGAAGGGSVATGGGALGQALVWASAPLVGPTRLQMGLGRLRSLRGAGLDSTVWELSLTRSFGLAGR